MLEAIISLCACVKYSISVQLAYHNALALDGSSVDLGRLRGADTPYAPYPAASLPADSADHLHVHNTLIVNIKVKMVCMQDIHMPLEHLC